MKNALIRIAGDAQFRHVTYVKTVSADGSFTITMRKENARRFTPERAAEVIRRTAGRTMLNLDICVAPEALQP